MITLPLVERDLFGEVEQIPGQFTYPSAEEGDVAGAGRPLRLDLGVAEAAGEIALELWPASGGSRSSRARIWRKCEACRSGRG